MSLEDVKLVMFSARTPALGVNLSPPPLLTIFVVLKHASNPQQGSETSDHASRKKVRRCTGVGDRHFTGLVKEGAPELELAHSIANSLDDDGDERGFDGCPLRLPRDVDNRI